MAEPELRSEAGVILAAGSEAPDGLQPMDAPGGRFAVLDYSRPYAGLKAAYDYLYGVYIPENGLELRVAPAMEIYLNGPQVAGPDQLKTEVCALVV